MFVIAIGEAVELGIPALSGLGRALLVLALALAGVIVTRRTGWSA